MTEEDSSDLDLWALHTGTPHKHTHTYITKLFIKTSKNIKCNTIKYKNQNREIKNLSNSQYPGLFDPVSREVCVLTKGEMPLEEGGHIIKDLRNFK